MNQEEIPNNSELRDKLRKNLKCNRETNRNKDNDCFRCGLGQIKNKLLENENLTSKDVKGIANRIKRRKQADEKDLTTLSHSFLQDSENIKTFLEVRDAINIIIKMLTGQDSILQVLACECLCNLSLGDMFCCEKVAKSCGSYITTYLDGSNKKLSKTCLWVLSNLAASGDDPLKVLISLKVVEKIMSFVEKSVDDDFTQECCYTIEAIIEFGKNLINETDKIKIYQLIFNSKSLKHLLKIQLLYKILVSLDYQINEDLTKSTIEYITNNFASKLMLQQYSVQSKDNNLEIIFSIRIIGNLVALYHEASAYLIFYLQQKNVMLSQLINNILDFNNEIFTKELYWMAGNVYNSTNVFVIDYLKIDDLVLNLKIVENHML